MAISFKNVGEKTETRNRRIQAEVPNVPIGVVTPLRAGDDTDGIFKMHRDLAAQIKDNFRNLLLTNRGDRVIQTDLGANLQELAMERIAPDDFDSEAMLRIKRTTERYMPFIVLEDFESTIVDKNTDDTVGRVNIRVTYDVPSRGITNQAIELSFFLGG